MFSLLMCLVVIKPSLLLLTICYFVEDRFIVLRGPGFYLLPWGSAFPLRSRNNPVLAIFLIDSRGTFRLLCRKSMILCWVLYSCHAGSAFLCIAYRKSISALRFGSSSFSVCVFSICYKNNSWLKVNCILIVSVLKLTIF